MLREFPFRLTSHTTFGSPEQAVQSPGNASQNPSLSSEVAILNYGSHPLASDSYSCFVS